MKRSKFSKFGAACVGAVLASAVISAATREAGAADPDITFREAIRSVVTTNGIAPNTVGNAQVKTNAAIERTKLSLGGLTTNFNVAAGGITSALWFVDGVLTNKN
jgi:hypothetical protein